MTRVKLLNTLHSLAGLSPVPKFKNVVLKCKNKNKLTYFYFDFSLLQKSVVWAVFVLTVESTYPSGKSLSNKRLQSTTCPPVPIRSLDWRLTIKIIKELLKIWHLHVNYSYSWKRNSKVWRAKLNHVLVIFSFPPIKIIQQQHIFTHVVLYILL